MLDGVENHLLELFFSFFKTSDIIPLDVGDLYNCLSEGGWVARAGGSVEVSLFLG